ncbi:hypothetical protein QEN19_000773 [Hanseniaspora menglaensis]
MSTTAQEPSLNAHASNSNINAGQIDPHYDENNKAENQPIKNVNKQNWAQNISLTALRCFQFMSSVITLGLTSFVRSSYGRHKTRRQNFSIAVAAISTFYLLVLFFLLVIAQKLIIPGAILICEFLLCLLWLIAFIILADLFGKYSCATQPASNFDTAASNNYQGSDPSGYSYYNPFLSNYTNKTYKNTCRSSKTAIAFAGLSFVLFLLSTIFFYIFVIKRIITDYGTWKDVFKRSNKINIQESSNGVEMHRGSGLALTNAKIKNIQLNNHSDYVQHDTNNAGDLHDENYHNTNYDENYNTYSTQGSTVKTAGDDAYHEKHHTAQTGNHNNFNISSIPEDSNKSPLQTKNTANSNAFDRSNNVSQKNQAVDANTASKNKADEAASRLQIRQGYEAGAAGISDKTKKAGATGAGIVAGSNPVHGGYYNSDPIGDEVVGKESQAQTPIFYGEKTSAGEQPSLVQQAVDASKKYMNVA